MNDQPARQRLSEGHPGLGAGHLETYLGILEKLPDDTPRIARLLVMLDRLVDLQPPKDIVVVGCGPRPRLVRLLSERGYRAVGVEPVLSFVASAQAYLGSSASAVQGWLEALPFPPASQDVVLCESVLEHVDSPRLALDEIFRVLRPGGIAYITTTNRLRFSPRGDNGEFNVRFFNWLPRLVKESYVFRHLHQEPSLANYSLRPAVHWFTYVDLCWLGRQSGFAQFYSLLDLLTPDDPTIAHKWWRRRLLRPLQSNAWLRALALTQIGHAIAMLKRSEP